MPAKVYLDSPPGDFRAMPARGDGLAIVKWVTSFPEQPGARAAGRDRGRPRLRCRRPGRALAIIDCRVGHMAANRRRGGGLGAGPGPRGRTEVGLIGCGVNGAWAARCLAAAGYGPGVCHDPRAAAAGALAEELGWDGGNAAGGRRPGRRRQLSRPATSRSSAARPAARPAPRRARRRRPRQGGGRAGGDPPVPPVLRRVEAGEHRRRARGPGRGRRGRRKTTSSEIGAVLHGRRAGPTGRGEITLFDSTGLAIQDLGIVHAVMRALEENRIEATPVVL